MIASGTSEYAAANGRSWATLMTMTLPMNCVVETSPGTM